MSRAIIPTWRPAPWRSTAAFAALAVAGALALPGLAALDGRASPPVEYVIARLQAGLQAAWSTPDDGAPGADDDQRLRQQQEQAELELLLAEAMWGEAPAELQALQLVRIETARGPRLALVDPTGDQAPRWVRESRAGEL